MTRTSTGTGIPFDIPELASRNMRIGEQGLVRRCFPEDRNGFFRIYEGDSLELEVSFERHEPRSLVHLYTNVDGAPEEWRELPFSRDENGVHRFSYRVRRRGNYQFKVKYSLDGGDSWYWDRLPFSRVIVDVASLKDIRMYTLIPAVSGSVTDWTDKLDHIAVLGFNAVHLLPLTERDVSRSPYSARDLFSLDPAYRESDDDPGGLFDLEHFVRAARDRGIRLCFDLTLNHIGVESRMARQCPEWIVPDRSQKDGMKRAGCWHMNTWLVWNDLVTIYYDHPHPEIQRDIWEYMTRYSLFWGHFASLTGGMVRLDNLHSSHEGFIAHVLQALRKECPDLVVMAEFFTDSNTVLKKAEEWHIDLFLANAWEYPYAEDLRNYIGYIHDIGRQVRHFVPITTHDTGAPAQLFGAPEAAVPRYAVTALMGTGRTGIVQGTEQGVPEKISFIGSGQRIDNGGGPIADGIRRINDILERSELFHREGNIDFVDRGHGAVIAAFRRAAKAGEGGYLVCANLDVVNGHRLDIDLSPFFEGEPHLCLENVVTGGEESVPAGVVPVELQPHGVAVFRCAAGR